MALARPIVCDGLLDELDRFEALLQDLSPQDWEQPTRCGGWTVGDVARHVVGTVADVSSGVMDRLGSGAEVAERQGRGPAELAAECAAVRGQTSKLLALFDDTAWSMPAPSGYDGELGDGVEALWYDAFLHADDIRDALGMPTVLSPGLAAACSHVQLELDKRGWSGEMPDEGADAMDFVLAATGRQDPAKVQGKPINIYAPA